MRVLLAARLSKKQANGQDGIGLETQDSRMREWAERNGHEVVAIAADTRSGTVPPWDRPSLKPWVTEPERIAQYDAIVAYCMDRLTRADWDDESRIRQWAGAHGKVLMTESGAYWPPRNDGDRWRWESEAISARKEWEAGRERSMRAQAELRERGKLVGRPPFGYVSVGEKYDHTIEPTEIGRTYVPQIFARCIAGDSLATICEWLDSERVPTPSGGIWSPKSVGQIIRTTTYAGHRKDANGLTVLRCEPVVDAATFRRAGEALDSRPKRGPVVAEPALLTRKLFCIQCEGPMYRIRTGHGLNIRYYYRCAGRGTRRKGCGNMVRLDRMDALADKALSGLREPDKVPRVKLGTNHQAEIDGVQMELDNLPKCRLDDAAEDAERARLRKERKRLENLPATDDEVVYDLTGETVGDKWRSLANTWERRAWLASRPDIRLYVKRDAELGIVGDMKVYGLGILLTEHLSKAN